MTTLEPRESNPATASSATEAREIVDVSRRDWVGILGALGGAFGLAACSSSADGAGGRGHQGAGESTATVAQALSGSVIWFDTIVPNPTAPGPCLTVCTPPPNGTVAIVEGYAAPGDGGQGMFCWNGNSTSAPDDGTILEIAGSTGRWLRIYSGPLFLSWFGGVSAAGDHFAAAVAAAASASPSSHNTRTLVVDAPVTLSSSPPPIPSGVTLQFVEGYPITINSGVTFTINGPLEAGLYQIFAPLGQTGGTPTTFDPTAIVVFGWTQAQPSGSPLATTTQYLYPEWWGADGNGLVDPTSDSWAALQYATYCSDCSNNIPIFLAGSQYNVFATGNAPKTYPMYAAGTIVSFQAATFVGKCLSKTQGHAFAGTTILHAVNAPTPMPLPRQNVAGSIGGSGHAFVWYFDPPSCAPAQARIDHATGGGIVGLAIVKPSGYAGGVAIYLCASRAGGTPNDFAFENVLVRATDSDATHIWEYVMYVDGTWTSGGVRDLSLVNFRCAHASNAGAYLALYQVVHFHAHALTINTAGDGNTPPNVPAPCGLTFYYGCCDIHIQGLDNSGSLTFDPSVGTVFGGATGSRPCYVSIVGDATGGFFNNSNAVEGVACVNAVSNSLAASPSQAPYINSASASLKILGNVAERGQATLSPTAPTQNVTGDGTLFTVPWDTILYDDNKRFNVSPNPQGSFTCSSQQIYSFWTQIEFTGINTTTNPAATVWLKRYRASDPSTPVQAVQMSSVPSSVFGGKFVLQAFGFMVCQANDFVIVQVAVNGPLVTGSTPLPVSVASSLSFFIAKMER